MKPSKESISSVIWVQPRIVTECPELKIVCDEFSKKYGKGSVASYDLREFHPHFDSTLVDLQKNICNNVDLAYRLLVMRFRRS